MLKFNIIKPLLDLFQLRKKLGFEHLESELAKSDLSLKQLGYFAEHSDAKFLKKVEEYKEKLNTKPTVIKKKN